MSGGYDIAPGVGHDVLTPVVFFDNIENHFNVREIAFDRDIVLPGLEYSIVFDFNQNLACCGETRFKMTRPKSAND